MKSEYTVKYYQALQRIRDNHWESLSAYDRMFVVDLMFMIEQDQTLSPKQYNHCDRLLNRINYIDSF